MLTINTNVMALNAQLALNQQTRKIDQLSKVMTAANSEGLGEFNIGGPAASIVPNFITSAIAGNAVALSNVDSAKNLLLKEKTSVIDMLDAVNTMKTSAITYNINRVIPPTAPTGTPTQYEQAAYDTELAAFTATQNGLAADFRAAQARLSSNIASAVYNGINLSDGGRFQFQIGPNPNENIAVRLERLDEQIGDLKTISITGEESNINYAGFTATLSGTKGNVDATISQLGFAKSRLEFDYENTTTYRKNLLDSAYSEAYPVDSGSPTCSVLSGCNRAVTRARFDGRRSFACPIPEGLC